MINLENHQEKVKYVLIFLTVILITVVFGVLYQASNNQPLMTEKNPLPSNAEQKNSVPIVELPDLATDKTPKSDPVDPAKMPKLSKEQIPKSDPVDPDKMPKL